MYEINSHTNTGKIFMYPESLTTSEGWRGKRSPTMNPQYYMACGLFAL
jgi:hypothetical protein